MAIVSVIVDIVEQTWDLSVVVMPALFITLFTYYLFRQDSRVGIWAASTAGQRDVVLSYSPYLITGFVCGGIVNYLFGGAMVPGALVVAGFLGFAMVRRDVPDTAQTDHGVSAYLHHGVWAVVLVSSGIVTVLLLVAALSPVVTDISWGVELAQHVLAVVFYAVVFWEL